MCGTSLRDEVPKTSDWKWTFSDSEDHFPSRVVGLFLESFVLTSGRCLMVPQLLDPVELSSTALRFEVATTLTVSATRFFALLSLFFLFFFGGIFTRLNLQLSFVASLLYICNIY